MHNLDTLMTRFNIKLFMIFVLNRFLLNFLKPPDVKVRNHLNRYHRDLKNLLFVSKNLSGLDVF